MLSNELKHILYGLTLPFPLQNKKTPRKTGALLCAGSETRTRTTVKSQVFETSASTIPPFPPLWTVQVFEEDLYLLCQHKNHCCSN